MKNLLLIGILFAASFQCAAFSPPDVGELPDEGIHYAIAQDMDIMAEAIVIVPQAHTVLLTDAPAPALLLEADAETFDLFSLTLFSEALYGAGYEQPALTYRWHSERKKYPALQLHPYKSALQKLARPPSYSLFV